MNERSARAHAPLNKETNMAILKLDKHDEDKEIEFELDYLMSLTTAQRFEMMYQKTMEILILSGRTNADRKATEVIKRQ